MSSEIRRAKQMTFPMTTRYSYSEWERMQRRRERMHHTVDTSFLIACLAIAAIIVSVILRFHVLWLISWSLLVALPIYATLRLTVIELIQQRRDAANLQLKHKE